MAFSRLADEFTIAFRVMKENIFFFFFFNQDQQIDKCEQYLQGVLPLKIHTQTTRHRVDIRY